MRRFMCHAEAAQHHSGRAGMAVLWGLASCAGWLLAAMAAVGALTWSAETAAQLPSTGPRSVSAPLTGSATSWNELNARQKAALAPLQKRWNDIAPDHRQKWLTIANRFAAMPKVEQDRIQARMTEWAQMTPQERGRARLRFQEAKRLQSSDRQAKWQQYQALTPEQRQELSERAAQRARSASPAANAETAAKLSAHRAPPAGAAREAQARTAGPAAKPVREVAIAPAVVQAKPGATTTLITKRAAPQQAGRPTPHIAAARDTINTTTLLPRKAALTHEHAASQPGAAPSELIPATAPEAPPPAMTPSTLPEMPNPEFYK